MSKIKQLKQELKVLAASLREAKQVFKQGQRVLQQGNFNLYSEWAKTKGLVHPRWNCAKYPRDLSSEYRHMHIAYCLLRGRTMEQIENKVREGNSPNMTQVENIMREYREVEEIQCAEVVNV